MAEAARSCSLFNWLSSCRKSDEDSGPSEAVGGKTVSAVPSMKLNVTAVVVGSVALIVLGGIGISGLLHANGIISAFPGSFSWIGTIGTPGCAAMVAGAGLGVLAIGLGARNIHLARMAAKAETTELDDDEDKRKPKLTLNLWSRSAGDDASFAHLANNTYWLGSIRDSGEWIVVAKSTDGRQLLQQMFPKGTKKADIHSLMGTGGYTHDLSFEYVPPAAE